MNSSNRPTPYPLFYLLGAISSLSPFGVVVIVPIIPMIGLLFDQGPGNLQYLASAYLLGLALGQPCAGVLSDKFGRRPLLLAGFLIFILSSIGLAFSTNFGLMVMLRFIQAVGASVGSVIARAIARDLFDQDEAIHAFSFMSAAMGIAPIIAPIIGGAVAHLYGHQSVYLVTAIVGGLVLHRAWMHVPETRPNIRQDVQQEVDGIGIRTLLSSPRFLGYTGIFGFTQGTFFSFLGIGAAIFSDYFSIGALGFGMIWGSLAIFYVLGSTRVNPLAEQFGRQKLTKFCVFASIGVAWSGVLSLQLFDVNLFTVLIPLAGLMFFSGMLIPIAMFGAVEPFPQISGTASGISSSCGLVAGGIFSIVSGSVYTNGYQYVALLSAAATIFTGLSWLLVQYGSKEILIDEAEQDAFIGGD